MTTPIFKMLNYNTVYFVGIDCSFLTIAFQGQCLIYEPVTKGQDQKWEKLPKNQTLSFS